MTTAEKKVIQQQRSALQLAEGPSPGRPGILPGGNVPLHRVRLSSAERYPSPLEGGQAQPEGVEGRVRGAVARFYAAASE